MTDDPSRLQPWRGSLQNVPGLLSATRQIPDKKAFRLTHDDAGLSHLCERVRALVKTGAQVRVVVEASGGYERLLHQTMTAAGVAVAIVNPKRVRDYAKGIGRLAKTDRVDAQVLARWCWPATV